MATDDFGYLVEAARNALREAKVIHQQLQQRIEVARILCERLEEMHRKTHTEEQKRPELPSQNGANI